MVGVGGIAPSVPACGPRGQVERWHVYDYREGYGLISALVKVTAIMAFVWLSVVLFKRLLK